MQKTAGLILLYGRPNSQSTTNHGDVDQIQGWDSRAPTHGCCLVELLTNRHTKANDLVHDFHPGQNLAHLRVVAAQAQLRADELLEAIHGRFSL